MVRTTPEDDHDRKLLADIGSHGWHLVGISEDDDSPAYVFSVGLFHTLGQPEICIFGLSDTAVMGQIINGIGDLMREGQRFDDWHSSEDVLDGYQCIFRAVNEAHYHEYFGYARWFYQGNEFPMLQCVWPDRSGSFPWDSDFNPQMLLSQPVLATVSAWPFLDAKNTAVFTTNKVTGGDLPILFVVHDEDGDWQFLCGTTNNADDCQVVCLSDLVESHPAIADLADLPLGWRAEREDGTSPWHRFRLDSNKHEDRK